MPAVDTETPDWSAGEVTGQVALWPNIASNATQTVGPFAAKLESIRTQTVESFLSSSQQEDLLDIASELLSDSIRSSVESNAHFSANKNSSTSTLSESATLPVQGTSARNRDFIQSGVILNDISGHLVDDFPAPLAATRTLHRQKFTGNGLLGINCAGEQTLSPSIDQLMNSVGDSREQVTPSSSQLSRVMLTSASQTMPDFDAVSTQTMDCDFDGDIDIDFDDFIHTETQTNDMLASYFSFADIETQTANDMQYWDSETQTCFDALLSP